MIRMAVEWTHSVQFLRLVVAVATIPIVDDDTVVLGYREQDQWNRAYWMDGWMDRWMS